MYKIERNNFVLPYKENRDYLHGTTMFDTLRALIGFERCTDITVSIGGMIKGNAVSILSSVDGGLPDEKYPVRGKAHREDGELYFAIEADTGNPEGVSSSERYDEDEIFRAAEFDAGKVFCDSSKLAYSFIEIIVALNKEMLKRTIPKEGKYLFVKIDLKRYVAPAHVMLELVSNMNNKMFRTRVSGDGAVLGDIYFTLV